VSSHYLHEKLILIFLLEIGSVIKHQLVSHLTLGIALRGVLDALRKNIDSKVCYGYSFLLSVNSIVQSCTSNGMLVADVYIRHNSAGAVYGTCNCVAAILQPYSADFTSSWNTF
jgi:hypothetical protein